MDDIIKLEDLGVPEDSEEIKEKARNKRKGWSSWGNEIEIFAKGKAKIRKRPSKWIDGKQSSFKFK